MFAACSLVMLGVNALLFFTVLMEKTSARKLLGVGLILAMAGLAVPAQHRSEAGMYLGVSLTSAGTGLLLPVIALLAAGASAQTLGITDRRSGGGSWPRPDTRIGHRRMALRCPCTTQLRLADRALGRDANAPAAPAALVVDRFLRIPPQTHWPRWQGSSR